MKHFGLQPAETINHDAIIDPAEVAFTVPMRWGRLRISEAAGIDYGFEPSSHVRYVEGDAPFDSNRSVMGMPATDILILGTEEPISSGGIVKRQGGVVGLDGNVAAYGMDGQSLAANLRAGSSAQQLSNASLEAIMAGTGLDKVEDLNQAVPEWEKICTASTEEAAKLLQVHLAGLAAFTLMDVLPSYHLNAADKRHGRNQYKIAAGGILAIGSIIVGGAMLGAPDTVSMGLEGVVGGGVMGGLPYRTLRHNKRQEVNVVSHAMRAQQDGRNVAYDIMRAIEPTKV